MGNVIDTVLNSLDDLLRIPRGCGEQTMLYLAPNVYIYTYLKKTKQFTPDLETSSRQYIKDGKIQNINLIIHLSFANLRFLFAFLLFLL